jgi:hypothetical protein
LGRAFAGGAGILLAICVRGFVAEFSIFFLAPQEIRVLSLSVVEQEKGKKADQNPEHRTENSEPQ